MEIISKRVANTRNLGTKEARDLDMWAAEEDINRINDKQPVFRIQSAEAMYLYSLCASVQYSFTGSSACSFMSPHSGLPACVCVYLCGCMRE